MASQGWLFTREEIEAAPSRRAGLSAVDDVRYRKDGAILIRKLGVALKMAPSCYATGIVFFHRFYMVHSFQAFSRWLMAAACLFVAGKVEEQPRKLSIMLPILHALISKKKPSTPGEEPPELDAKMEKKMREQILGNERVLLQTLSFDFAVCDPYQYLFKFAKALTIPGGKDSALKDIVQKAYNFVSDSLVTSLCIQHRPQVIAAAILRLAARINKTELVIKEGATGTPWFMYFLEPSHLPGLPTTVADLDDIAYQVMYLYEDRSLILVPDGSAAASDTSTPEKMALAAMVAARPSTARRSSASKLRPESKTKQLELEPLPDSVDLLDGGEDDLSKKVTSPVRSHPYARPVAP